MTDDLPIEKLLTAEFRAAIGSLIAQFAGLEFAMTDAASQLIGNDVDSRLGSIVAINGMDIRVKLGVLKTLVELRFDEAAQAEFKKWHNEVEKIAAQRHVAAHSFWMRGEEPGCYVSASFKTVSNFKRARGEMGAEDFRAWTMRAEHAMTALVDFLARNGRPITQIGAPQTP